MMSAVVEPIRAPDAEAACALTLYGRPRAVANGVALALPEKAFALAALVLAEPGRALSRETIWTFLFQAAPAARRSGNLRQLLHRVTQILGGLPPLFATDPLEVRMAARGWRFDLDDDADDLQALARPRGDLLADLPSPGPAFDDWLSEFRRRLDGERAGRLAHALGRAPGADPRIRAAAAERLVALDPAEEVGHRALMTALVDMGDAARARRAFLECRRLLKAEAEADPSPETLALAVRLGLEAPAAPTAASGLPAAAAEPVGLGAPRVVILPPTTAPGDDLLDRLGYAILDDVTVGLSQFRSFRIVAAHTSYQLLRRRVRSLADLPAEMDFDYAVTIGVRRRSDAVAAQCRLTRLADGETLWAIELPLTASNLHASLDMLVRRLVTSLAEGVDGAEGRRPIGTADATGYRLYLEGKRAIGATRLEALRHARRFFNEAVKRCDDFSAAYAGLSRSLSMEWLVRGMGDGAMLESAEELARRARRCDPANGRALRELGFVALYRRRHEESLAHFAEARLLSPHDGDLLADHADALLHDGQTEEAARTMALARELNPIPPDYYVWIEASIQYQAGAYAEAMATLAPVADRAATARLLAASAAMAGDLDAARRHADTVRENYPGFRVADVPRIVPDRRPEDAQQLMEGLYRAGLT